MDSVNGGQWNDGVVGLAGMHGRPVSWESKMSERVNEWKEREKEKIKGDFLRCADRKSTSIAIEA